MPFDLIYLLFIAALAATGMVAGLLAGLLGVGGGIAIVPVFFLGLGVAGLIPEIASHLAVGTSLAAIIPTSISAMRAHSRKGNVDRSLLKRWAITIFIGAAVGGVAARFIPGEGLRAVFGGVAILVAINLALPKQLTVASAPPLNKWVNGFVFGIVGFLSSLMGIGGGTLAVPIFTAFSIPVHKAVGTASALGLLIAIPGTIGFMWAGWGRTDLPPLSLGYVSAPAALIIAPFSYLFAPIAVRVLLMPSTLVRSKWHSRCSLPSLRFGCCWCRPHNHRYTDLKPA
jgi:uncharacterized protein